MLSDISVPTTHWRVWLGLAFLIIATAACAPDVVPTTQSPATSVTQAAPSEQAAPSVQLTPSQQARQAKPENPAEPATPTQLAQPVISSEFTPSDPSQVVLAAGRPQFVEFFAFW